MEIIALMIIIISFTATVVIWAAVGVGKDYKALRAETIQSKVEVLQHLILELKEKAIVQKRADLLQELEEQEKVLGELMEELEGEQ